MRASIIILLGKKSLVGCEIGVDLADNALTMLENLDIKRLYLVDVWGMPKVGQDKKTLKIAKRKLKK